MKRRLEVLEQTLAFLSESLAFLARATAHDSDQILSLAGAASDPKLGQIFRQIAAAHHRMSATHSQLLSHCGPAHEELMHLADELGIDIAPTYRIRPDFEPDMPAVGKEPILQ